MKTNPSGALQNGSRPEAGPFTASSRATASLLAILALAVVAGTASAQPTRMARLLITVVDPSGGVIPGATVTSTGLEDATRRVATAPVKTTNEGRGTIENLLPGHYQVQAEFPGFEPGLLKDVRLRAGDNRHVIVLPLMKIEEAVTVERDPVLAAADPRGGSLVTAVTHEEIEALSDDPSEMAQQLIDMAGGNAVIKIDSFIGGTLPPKALIKSIHIVRDTFPAENHSDESDEIDIITQPGAGKIHGGGNTRLRDGAMSGRNPFVSIKAPERTQNFDGHFGGAIIPQKSSFSLSFGSRRQYDTPLATFATATGKQSVLLGQRPTNSWNVFGLFDYALTPNHIVRLSYDQSASERKNLGVGGFDLAERAYSTSASDHEVRIQEAGPIGRRVYANTRLQATWADSASHSVLEAPTVRVLDGVTTGGGQVAGGRRTKELELASDVDYLRGIHTFRTGVLLDSRWYRSDNASNYLGTFTFTSPAAFAAGTPARYSRRVGDPLITYWNLQAAAYVQDDIKIRKNLTFSPGLRYEAQTHLSDFNGFAPRAGLTWAPTKSGKTTIRTSYGVFYNWLSSGTYEQTLRVDGFRQRDLNIFNPRYPDVGTVGAVSATDRYLLGPDTQLERYIRVGAAVDHTVSPKVRMMLSYATARFDHQLRGLNLNAPGAGGVRPDPDFANVIQVVSDAATRTHDIGPNLNINLAGGVRGANQPRWNPRRTQLQFMYRYRRTFNNSDGAFNPPPSGTLDTEWAPSRQDTRHRLRAGLTSQALKNLNARLNLEANSGSPFTITTGTDDNGDGIFNDRPFGIGRTTERLPWRTTISMNVSYLVPFGTPRPETSTERGGPPYGVTFNVSVQNLTNRANYTGFSGQMTSQYFLQPTSVANPRQIDVGMRFTF